MQGIVWLVKLREREEVERETKKSSVIILPDAHWKKIEIHLLLDYIAPPIVLALALL